MQQRKERSEQSTISSQASSSVMSVKPILNYGERLYQKGIKKKEELQRHIQEQKAVHEKQAEEEFSFKPQINDLSRVYQRPGGERAEDFLLNYGRA